MNIVAEPIIPYGRKQVNWYIPIFLKSIDIIDSPIVFEQDLLYSIALFSQRAFKTRGRSQLFSFSWEGGLNELKNEFNGVSLQHYINTLRK